MESREATAEVLTPEAPEGNVFSTSDLVKASALLAVGHAFRGINFKGRIGHFAIVSNPEASHTILEVIQHLKEGTGFLDARELIRKHNRLRYDLHQNLRAMQGDENAKERKR